MSMLSDLNLRPQERRLIVLVGFIFFVAMNWIFVRPLFGQWGVAKNDLHKAQATLERYRNAIGNAPKLEAEEKKLKSSGSDVLSEELALQRIVDNRARAANVQISRYTPGVRSNTGRTNQFFEDQGLSIDVSTGGKELVDFLVGMASENSMVRVQEMSLRPDPSQTKLIGNILFVASYQKKQPAKPVATTATTTAKPTTAPAAAKPATNAVKSGTPSKPATNANKIVTPPKATNAGTNPLRAMTNKVPAQTNSTKPLKK